MHAELPVNKTVTVGANLHRQLQFYHRFPYISYHQLTLKNISRGYAQYKGFIRFNLISTSEVKIDERRKL